MDSQFRKAIFSVLFSACLPLIGFADAPRVTLAWDHSEGSAIAGYKVYQGLASGDYNQITDVGNQTLSTVSNLVMGATYYFAVSAYDKIGLESDLSSEISYTVTVPLARLQLTVDSQNHAVLTGTAPNGYSYKVLSTEDLQMWSPLATVRADANGSFVFTDSATTVEASPARFYRLEQIVP